MFALGAATLHALLRLRRSPDSAPWIEMAESTPDELIVPLRSWGYFSRKPFVGVSSAGLRLEIPGLFRRGHTLLVPAAGLVVAIGDESAQGFAIGVADTGAFRAALGLHKIEIVTEQLLDQRYPVVIQDAPQQTVSGWVRRVGAIAGWTAAGAFVAFGAVSLSLGSTGFLDWIQRRGRSKGSD